MQYRLISNGFLDSFNQDVNEFLRDGCQLYGAPFATMSDYGATYFQALVKPTK